MTAPLTDTVTMRAGDDGRDAGGRVIAASVDALVAAVGDAGARQIAVQGRLTEVPTLRLQPGQSLRGTTPDAALIFRAGMDGVMLSCGNEVAAICLETSPDQRSLFNDMSRESFEQLTLRDVTAVGRVQILAGGRLRSGDLDVSGLDVVGADARFRCHGRRVRA
jgi:hypothetical protein